MQESVDKTVNVIITQQGDIRNIGEHALLRSEAQLLRDTFKKVHISVFTLYPQRIKAVEPTLSIFSPLIDLQLGKKRATSIVFTPFILILQILLTWISVVLVQLNLKPIYRSEVVEAIKKADLVVSSGTQAFREGTVFQSKQSIGDRTTNLFMLFWGVYEVFLAKKVFKKPFISFPQSVGPFKSAIGKTAIKYIINNSNVYLLRESSSVNLLNGIDIKTPIYVTMDMGFLFNASPIKAQALQKSAIGVSPCFPHSFSQTQKDNYVTTHSKVLDYMVEKYSSNIYFLPSVIGQGATERLDKSKDDCEVSQMILEKMVHKEKAKILIAKTADDFSSMAQQLDILIATRMHPNILASVKIVPSLPIIYEHKQMLLLKKLDQASVAINISNLTYGTLLAKTEYLWNHRSETQKMLQTMVPAVRQETGALVKQVITRVTNCGSSTQL